MNRNPDIFDQIMVLNTSLDAALELAGRCRNIINLLADLYILCQKFAIVDPAVEKAHDVLTQFVYFRPVIPENWMEQGKTSDNLIRQAQRVEVTYGPSNQLKEESDINF